MKGKISNDVPPNARTYTCIPTCEKGIYAAFQMESQRGRNYQMLAFSGNSVLSNKTVLGGSI